MFTKRTVTLLGLSLVMGVGAVWLANRWVEVKSTAMTQVAPEEAIVATAALDIPLGQKLEPRHIKMVSMPKEIVPKGVVEDPAAIEGKIATQKFFEGEMLMKARISDHLGGNTFAAMIEPEMRAVTVRVNDVVGVAGFLLPGNRVDVLSSRRVDRNKRVVTETVLQDIKVLAVDQTARTEKNEPIVVRAVTLELNPKQAETLIKARDEGNIQLALRNPVDQKEVVTKEPVKKRVVKRRPRRRTPDHVHVTVIRGVTQEKTKASL